MIRTATNARGAPGVCAGGEHGQFLRDPIGGFIALMGRRRSVVKERIRDAIPIRPRSGGPSSVHTVAVSVAG
jgi:hypothetical protein